MESFAVTRKDQGAVSILYPGGKMDHHTAPTFESALRVLWEEKRYKIIINLQDLQYISSAGLNVLMQFIDDIRPGLLRAIRHNLRFLVPVELPQFRIQEDGDHAL